MAKDALGAHARDELGISEITTARPMQAALASATTFSVGAAVPLALALVSPSSWIIPAISVGSLVFLALLGMIGAKAGGANILKPTIRVTFWGPLAMGVNGRDRCHLWYRRLRIGTFGRVEPVTPLGDVMRTRSRACATASALSSSLWPVAGRPCRRLFCHQRQYTRCHLVHGSHSRRGRATASASAGPQ